MLKPEDKQLLKRFHHNLNDKPLSPDSANYVQVFEPDENGYLDDPISEISTNIAFSETSSVGLLTGQRGSGKSTELLRLKKILEDEEDCVVFLCDMSLYMNLTTPVEITDFLISLMTALSDAFLEVFGEDLLAEGYLTRISNFLQQEVQISDATLKSGLGNIKASLIEDPSFKRLLQQQLKGHVAKIVAQEHKFAAEVVNQVRQKKGDPDKKVVILVDSVEQIRGVGEDAATVYKTVENLFNAHAPSLRIPLLHMLYTIPPYLSPLAPNIARVLGGNAVYNLPSLHIKNKDDSEDPKGLGKMHEILSKRCEQVDQVFTQAQVKKLALLSGGDLRNFFRFIRQCLIKAVNNASGDLPVSDAILQHAENHARRELFLAEEDKSWLKKINESKKHQLDSIDNLPQLARFLDTGLVLNYRNGEDWYDVHPLVRLQLDD